MSDASDVRWWADLRSSALIGTGRRAVPAVDVLDRFGHRVAGTDAAPDPIRDLAPSAVALLDAAALGAMARRAGHRAEPVPAAAIEPAPPDDDRVEASPTASQLLELLVGPAPLAGIHRNDLIAHWCASCATSGRRVPDVLLVRTLDHATSTSTIRPAVLPALGVRGRWLAGLNPSWSWAAPTGAELDPGGTPDGDVDAGAWAQLPSARRVEVLAALRHRDPDRGRDLLVTTWTTDSATARAADLGVLADGLGAGDEPLLEAALDDRSKVVRQHAVVLLDGLPGSARARRMADRLRPLVTIEGRRRQRSVVVALPDDPDTAGVRDGLTPPPSARSARGYWLEQLTAGAPLELWTELTGDDPAATIELLAEANADVLAGLVRAVLARRDPTWSVALHGVRPDPRLLDLMPAGERVDLATSMLRRRTPPAGLHLVALLGHLPAPWSPALSALVIDALRADASAATTIQQTTPVLATALDASAEGRIESWLRGLEEQPHLAAALRTLIQYQSLHRSITEAFS